MKKIIFVIISFIMILCLCSCQTKFTDLKITMIDNEYIMSNSVVIIDSNALFAKVFDENNKIRLIHIWGYDPDYYKNVSGSKIENPMKYTFINLPDEITNFEFIGMYIFGESECNVYIKSIEGRIYDLYYHQTLMGSKYDVKEIDIDWNNSETLIGNFYSRIGEYLREGYLNFQYSHFENLKIKIDINESNDVYLNVDDNRIFIISNFSIRNMFFNPYNEDLGIILIGENNEVYHLDYFSEQKTLNQGSHYFDEKIINYGCLNAKYTDSKYFYIVTEQHVYIFNRYFEEIKVIEINSGLYGVGGTGSNSRPIGDYYNLSLCYKNEDGTLRIETINVILK